MVYVVVTMQIKKGRVDEFLKMAEELSGFIVKEPGCLAFDFTREVKSPLGIQEPIDPDRVTLIERWESMEALEVHTQPSASPDPRKQELSQAMGDMRESLVARVTELPI